MIFDFKRNHILQALLAAAIVWLAIKLSAILLVFFIAFLITVVLHPLVNWLHERHIPIWLSVLLPLLGLLILIALVGYFVVPNLVSESRQFATHLPDYISSLRAQFGFNFHLNTNSLRQTLQSHYGSLSSALITVTTKVVTLVVGVITVIVVTLYWLGSYDRIRATLITYFPKNTQKRADDIWTRVEKKLVSWFQAQLLLSVAVGVLVWIGALIVGLPFAGVLGLISGVLEIIPTLGPIAAAMPGILLGFTISPKTAVASLVMYIVVQQLENHLLAPFLLGRTVRLHPVIIILSLLIGAELYGIIGALLAVPVALVISSFVDSFRGDPHPAGHIRPKIPGKD